MLAACAYNGAEAKVKSELEKLQTSDTAAARLTEVQKTLPAESGKDLEAFLRKARDFDYKIIGSETFSDSSGEYTVVNVKIVSYDFGKEYLATWTEYLKSHSDAASEDADGREFYSELFSRLSRLRDRHYISYVEIKAIEPTGNGEWVTDISTNEDLQDALFGGMISEMKTLAAE